MPHPPTTPAALARRFKKYPLKPHTEWARQWGVSREWVRILRQKAGVPPISEELKHQRNQEGKARARQRTLDARTPSGRHCPVDGSTVPITRDVTCSPGCARKYQKNSKYRFRAKHPERTYVD